MSSSSNAVVPVEHRDEGPAPARRRQRDLELCECNPRMPVVLRTSWSPRNPGRKFFNCVNSMVSTIISKTSIGVKNKNVNVNAKKISIENPKVENPKLDLYM